jgi:hypothetical protein
MGVGLQRNFHWALAEGAAGESRRTTSGRSTAQIRAAEADLPVSAPPQDVAASGGAESMDVEDCAAAGEDRSAGAARAAGGAGRAESPIGSGDDMFETDMFDQQHQLPNIQEDEVLEQEDEEDKALAEQPPPPPPPQELEQQNENDPPSASGGAAAPLRRSGRATRKPHVRRESSGMVDSSLPHLSMSTDKGGNSKAPLRRSRRR